METPRILWRLGQAAIKNATSAVVTIAAVALSVAGLSPLVVLLIAGIAVAVVRSLDRVSVDSSKEVA